MDYKLQKDNSQGDLIEQTHGADPLKFLFGIGEMIPSFEENIEGMSAGQSTSFGIAANNAYGDYDQEALVTFPLEQFLSDEVKREDLAIGRTLNMQDNSGKVFPGVIKGISLNEIKIDFNHPMAGQDLFFSIEIREVRDATESELDHGHVHE